MTLNQKELEALKMAADASCDKLAWSQNGTDGEKTMQKLELLGLIQKAGPSANGMYWTATVDGIAFLNQQK